MGNVLFTNVRIIDGSGRFVWVGDDVLNLAHLEIGALLCLTDIDRIPNPRQVFKPVIAKRTDAIFSQYQHVLLLPIPHWELGIDS